MTRRSFTTFCLALLLGVQLAMGSSLRASPTSQNRNLETRIVGGTKANQKRFPYYTYVMVGTTDRSWFCGGSLIARDVVLTAAHCLVSEYSNITAVDVWVNSSSVKYSKYEYYREALSLVVHPLYQQHASSTSTPNDLGLIFLDEPVTGVPLVKVNRNASVPSSVNPPFLTAIGLGATGYNESSGSFTYPNVLMQASIKPISMLACKKVYGSVMIGEPTICAGGGGVRGICFGDSGGPLLMTKSSPQNDVIIGISSASFCPKQQGYPDLFTKVSSFAKWMDHQICTYSKDKPSSCPTLKPTAKPTSQLRSATANPTTKPTTGKP